jgi:Domain of unknown function (DUF1905)
VPTAPKDPETIDSTFTAEIVRENNSGWICVVMPGSGDFFGTRRAVKVAGTIDGHDFRATLLPMGDGTHMVPIKAALRKTVEKDLGDEVTVHLDKRFT